MSTDTTTQVLLAERPPAVPEPQHFTIETVDCPPLDEAQVRVAVDSLGIDAFIRTALNEDSFHRSVPIGGLVSALGVGVVSESTDEACLLYTSPSPRDLSTSRMPSSA